MKYKLFLFIVLIIGISVIGIAPAGTDLKHYYSFDSNNANDEEPTAPLINGNLTGDISTASGKLSNAYNLNLSGSVVLNGNSTTIFPSQGDLATSFWIKAPTVYPSKTAVLFSARQQSGGAKGFQITLNDSNKVFFIAQSGGTVITIGNNISMLDGNWHHIVAMYNYTSGAGNENLSLYVDGVQQNMSNPLANLGNIDINWPVKLGNASENPSDFQAENISIDEWGIWHRLLTPTEVAELWNNGNGLNPLKANFTLTFIDNYNSSNVANFSVNITNSTFSQIYSSNTSTGIVTTPLTPSEGGLFNVTFTDPQNKYLNSKVLNWNISTNLAGNATFVVARHNITAKENLTGATLNNFTIIDDGTYNTTTTTGSILYNHSWNTSSTITIIPTESWEWANYTFNNTVNEDHLFNLRTTNTFDITIYDEIRNTVLNWDNISVSVIAEGIYQSNKTTTNGSVKFPLVTPANYRINYVDTNNNSYFERDYFFTLANGTFKNLSLYLLNQSHSGVVTANGVDLNIVDSVNNKLEGAIVNVNKYFQDSNSYITVERLKTNFDGETKSYLTNDEFYRFVIEYEGQTRLSSQASKIFDTALTFRLNLIGDPTSDFKDVEGIDVSLTYLNATKTFTLTYTDSDSVASKFCVDIYEMKYTGEEFINSTCSTSQSGTLLVGFNPVNSSSYVGKAFAQIDGTFVLLDQLGVGFPGGLTFNSGGNGLFLIIILTLVFAGLGVFNPTIALILTPIPLLFASILEIVPISITTALGIYLAFIVGAIVIGRRT